MAEKMLAVRKMSAAPGLTVCEAPLPQVGRHEVLVQVEAASICGTDLHIWNWDQWSQQRIKPPITLGHEWAGTVIKTGPAVEHVREGDYVSAESHVTCGMCYQCRTGQAHMCPKTRILGVDRDGAFAQFVAVPEQVIWHNNRAKLPPEIACLQEPFGNAVFATMAEEVSGQSVLILGCGPIGLFSVGIAKASGAASVIASDVNPYRLGLAKTMGADTVLNAAEYDGNGIVHAVIEANEGTGVDVVLEMSGAPSAITTAFRAVRNGGAVILFGIPSKPVEIDVAENMIFKNVTVRAINGRRIFDTWYKTRWLLEHGVVNLRPLISKEIKIDQINEAMELLAAGKACKIVMRPNTTLETLPQPKHEAVDPNITGTVVHR